MVCTRGDYYAAGLFAIFFDEKFRNNSPPLLFMAENVLRYMGLGMGKVYGTICGYYTQVKINTEDTGFR